MSSYVFCGSSKIGKSHEVDGTVCQDSHYIREGNGFLVAAVADGLGTSKFSDIASSKAADSSTLYCTENIRYGMTDQEILHVIENAFDYANNLIKHEAGDDIDDYDTTLTLAVFCDGELYYGHAGDSGIIALCADGTFEEVTIAQLGEGEGKDRPVYPLIHDTQWVFEKFDKPARAIFLMTDGMLNMAVPPLLAEQMYKLDHAYLYYLYEELRDGSELQSWIDDELLEISPGIVNYDDKTLVVAICNTVRMTEQQPEYYKFPSDSLYKSLLAQKPMAAVAAPMSPYEKIVGGITNKELWKKNRKLIALVASFVVVLSVSTPVLVTMLRGSIDPVTGEWVRPSLAEAFGTAFTPQGRQREALVSPEEFGEDIEQISGLEHGEVEEDGDEPGNDRSGTGGRGTTAADNQSAPTPTPEQVPTPTPTPETRHTHNLGAAATCTTEQVCTICGEVLAAALGHSMGVWRVNRLAVCLASGTETRSCTRPGCSHTESRTIAALGHSPGAAATCTTAQVCDTCGDELVAALGHTPGSAATCIDPQVCTTCGYVLYAALGHDWEWRVTREPTCCEQGEETETCRRCQQTRGTRSIPATGPPGTGTCGRCSNHCVCPPTTPDP